MHPTVSHDGGGADHVFAYVIMEHWGVCGYRLFASLLIVEMNRSGLNDKCGI